MLDGQERLNDFMTVVKKVRLRMAKKVRETEDDVSNVVMGWMGQIADRFGVDRVIGFLLAMVERMGIEKAWNWFAGKTQVVKRKAAEFTSSFTTWGYLSEVKADVDEIEKRLEATTIDGICVIGNAETLQTQTVAKYLEEFDELPGDAKSMRIEGVTVDADTGVVGIRFREELSLDPLSMADEPRRVIEYWKGCVYVGSSDWRGE